jgi:hypothetical protein
MEPVSRKEDMSPRGQLRIFTDNEGDIHVSVFSDDGSGRIETMSSVEFCTCGIGGGQSPETRKALIELSKAMEMDNKNRPAKAGDL